MYILIIVNKCCIYESYILYLNIKHTLTKHLIINTMIIDYKRGEEIYRDNNGQIIEIEKVYHVYHVDQNNTNGVPNGKIGFICKNDYNEWFFYKNQHSDYFCGGLTMKETKENLEGILKQGFHPFLKADSITLKDYFN